MALYQFPCGCRWPVLQESADPDVLPHLDFDLDRAPPDCPAVWDMLGRGQTLGCFQLESSLGKTWCRRLRPDKEEHLGALAALLRPGCLHVRDDQGVNMTEHYCRRKNGEEEPEAFHPALEPILQKTYQIILFQEQLLRIGKEIAGFGLKEVYALQKGVSKKNQKVMAEVREMFLRGCEQTKILSAEQACTLWGHIQKSGRYLFSRNHAVPYGLTTYQTAYLKVHFPVQFFAGWLKTAHDQSDPNEEVRALVEEAKAFGVPVEPPDLRHLRPRFWTDGRTVYFGLADVKGVGDASMAALRKGVGEAETKLGKPLGEFTWYDVVARLLVPSSTLATLIKAGALRWLALPRQRMLAELDAFDKLTEKERDWVLAREFTSVPEALGAAARPKKEGGACSSRARVEFLRGKLQLLENPASPHVDGTDYLVRTETELLGVPLSAHRLDSYGLLGSNTTCQDFRLGKSNPTMTLGVEVKGVREIRTKNGDKMAFLTVGDHTGTLDDVVVFPDAWRECRPHLRSNAVVIITGNRDKKKGGFVVQKAREAVISK